MTSSNSPASSGTPGPGAVSYTHLLEVLLEIHSPSELSYINKEVDMVGVNNRNLGSDVYKRQQQARRTEKGD